MKNRPKHSFYFNTRFSDSKFLFYFLLFHWKNLSVGWWEKNRFIASRQRYDRRERYNLRCPNLALLWKFFSRSTWLKILITDNKFVLVRVSRAHLKRPLAAEWNSRLIHEFRTWQIREYDDDTKRRQDKNFAKSEHSHLATWQNILLEQNGKESL